MSERVYPLTDIVVRLCFDDSSSFIFPETLFESDGFFTPVPSNWLRYLLSEWVARIRERPAQAAKIDATNFVEPRTVLIGFSSILELYILLYTYLYKSFGTYRCNKGTDRNARRRFPAIRLRKSTISIISCSSVARQGATKSGDRVSVTLINMPLSGSSVSVSYL